MTPEQKALINEALEPYSASLTEDNYIQLTIMKAKFGIKLVVEVVENDRIKYLLPSGAVAATSSIKAEAIERFVESYFSWEKKLLYLKKEANNV